MSRTLTVAQRQFRSYFNSPAAYIVGGVVLLFVGVLFWPPFFLMGRASVREMFKFISWSLVFAAPAITMGLIAEERRSGTIELLITMPVKESQVIVGKYLAAVGLFAVILLTTLPYPLSVSTLGNLDWGPVWSGYAGMFLQGAAMVGVGLMASSWTDNQLIAFFIALAFGLFFVVVGFFLPFMPAGAASVLEWLSFDYHFESMARGVLDSRDVIYFASIIGFSLMLAFRALESRRWK